MAGRSLFSVLGSEGRNLLSAVLEKLTQRGWKGSSLRDILQAVGISKPIFRRIITSCWQSLGGPRLPARSHSVSE